MANKAKRHIHKYYRAHLQFGDVWACALSDCNHYMPQYMEAMVNGKASICWSCGEKFILDPISLQDEQPRCAMCKSGLTESDLPDDMPLSKAMQAFVDKGKAS